ncbi:hypothetical protein Pst134EA_000400 [Puccinia striiformis f. sp. tritici]|uniref:hypothetical protein n=1 Tax=Puccinia striiformis f. sp. tritici TaxID=168172 RepID=UPI0020085CAF|nr:hypothetical protein Pst134EA_000400 [Puccinia striiformis f. sp. tritici]KAH9473327.1 hypothetical protein Pst134EA_000400 [Puccinia striiformis f. sp. tritici]
MAFPSRSNRRAVGTSKAAPADPFNGIDYCQDELDLMTPAQRAYLEEHPNFWLEKKANEGDNSDDDQDAYEDPSGSPVIDNDLHMGGTTPIDGGNMQSDASNRFGKGRANDDSQAATARPQRAVPENPGAPYYHDDSTHTQGLVSPSLPLNYNGWERNLSTVLRIWGTAVTCATYDASHSADAAQWLVELEMMLEMIRAHPNTWHSVGCTMLCDRARDDFKLAKTEGTAPNTWESFKRWITRANPISPSKRSVAKAGNTLRQGPNEALDHFMKQFSAWQTQAKMYGLLYGEGLTFVLKLNAPLSKKLDEIMATEERRGFPMSFRDIQNAAIDENSRLPAQNLASTSATSKRSSGAGQSGSSKKTKGDASDRVCYNCNQPGHLSTSCTEAKTDKQLRYETKRAASGSNSTPLK